MATVPRRCVQFDGCEINDLARSMPRWVGTMQAGTVERIGDWEAWIRGGGIELR